MSEVLNLKYMLPERLHGRYISNDQIKRDPRPRDADIDTLAHVLVSERHGKFDLVRLVAYLLRECASTQADDARDAKDAQRLDWLLWKLPGDALRYCLGELSDTSDGVEFRSAIDAAMDAGIAQHKGER